MRDPRGLRERKMQKLTWAPASEELPTYHNERLQETAEMINTEGIWNDTGRKLAVPPRKDGNIKKKKVEHQRKRREELLKVRWGLGREKREGTSSWEECVSDLGGKRAKAYHVTSLADKEGVCWGPTR